jgi:hypothetical protein
MKVLLASFISLLSTAALAQPDDGIDQPTAQAEIPKTDDVPIGGCMPIGLTARGDLVFPMQCKEFLERHRGKPAEQKPAAKEEKAGILLPAWANGAALVKPSQAAKRSEGVAPDESKPAIKPVETVPLPKRRVDHVPRERAMSLDDYCAQNYRSYDPASGTYTGYDGLRRYCR